MAAYTSTQSGNFNDPASWGGSGYPSLDNDTFTIGAGHSITYNVTTPVATGFGDCTISAGGGLHFSAGARAIRIQGSFSIYGDLTMGANHTMYLNSAAANLERLWFYSGNGTTGCRKELIGDAPLPITTTSSATTAFSGVIPVTSSAGFSAGEWIAVFNREQTNHTSEREDEGFIIHEVSGNNIYVREFVGPSQTITNVDGAIIEVDDAATFRISQRVIFGTGSNRNIKEITDIDLRYNKITLNSSVTGSVIGETIYTTGPIKTHKLASTVRKCATVVTSDGTSASTTVTVANATGFQVGDEIIVESGVDVYTDDEKPEKRTISAINGNVITLSAAIGYSIYSGNFVLKLTRNCRIVNEGNTNFYVQQNLDGSWNRYLVLRDVEFYDIYNSNNPTNNRVYWRGYWRDDYDGDAAAIEGIVFNNDRSGSYMEIRFYDYLYRWTMRCCAFYNWHFIQEELGYVNADMAWFNNWSGRMETTGLNFTYKQGDNWEVAYNRVNGIDDTMYSIGYTRGAGLGFHHNFGQNCRLRSLDSFFHYGATLIYQNHFKNYFEGPLVAHSNMSRLIYNKFETESGALGDYYSFNPPGDNRRGNHPDGILVSYEHNFRSKDIAIYFSGGRADWDENEQAFLVTFDNDSSQYYGMPNQIFVPANATLRVRGTVKLVDGFSGNAPRLIISDTFNSIGATTSFVSGGYGDASIGWSWVDFANITGYQSQTLTLAPAPYGRYVNVSMVAISTTSSEGWYQKDLEIFLDILPPNAAFSNINLVTGNTIIAKKNSFTESKTRLGGRLR